MTSAMLSSLLYKTFNNGSRGFAGSSKLPGCLFWVAYFLALACTTNNSVWLCAAKLDSNSEASFSSFHFDFAQEIPITGFRDWLVERL